MSPTRHHLRRRAAVFLLLSLTSAGLYFSCDLGSLYRAPSTVVADGGGEGDGRESGAGKGGAAVDFVPAPYRYSLSHGPKTGLDFEKMAWRIPARRQQQQHHQADTCPNCHLNRACFNYSESIGHPAACPSADMMDVGRFSACMDGSRSVLVVGDSRTVQLAMEMAALADPGLFVHRNGEKTANGQNVLSFLVARKDALRPERGVAYELAHSWNLHRWSRDDGKVTSSFTDDLAYKKGRKFLVLSGNGAWTFRPPMDAARNAAYRREFSGEHLRGLRNSLALIEETMTDDLEVILVLDLLPVPTSEQGLDLKDNQVLFDGIQEYTNRTIEMVRNEFPFVRVMDSHLYADEAYVNICKRNKYNQHGYPPPANAVHFQPATQAWYCGDRWHPGRAFFRLLANLLLNHVCRP